MSNENKTCEGCAFAKGGMPLGGTGTAMGRHPAPIVCDYGVSVVSVVSHVHANGIYAKGIPTQPCPKYPDVVGEAAWLLNLAQKVSEAVV